MATLTGIAIRLPGSRRVETLDHGVVDLERGLLGDKRQRPGKRQLTLLSHSDWRAACAELGQELAWTLRRANLLVDHLELADSSGRRLRLGPVVLEVTGETDPCHKMEAACPGLYAALQPKWRGGVTCRVLVGGELRTGMAVAWLSETDALSGRGDAGLE